MCYFRVWMLCDLMFCFIYGGVYGCVCGDRERVWFVGRGVMVSLFAGWSDGGDFV